MEKKKRQAVRFEFFKYEGDPVLFTRQYTLKLGKPAEVTFFCQSPIGSSGSATINNAYNIQSYNDSINPLLAVAPAIVTLKTNINEIDNTNYSLLIAGNDCIVTVICKYYINEL